MATWNVRVLTDDHHAGLYEVHYDEAGNIKARTTETIVEGNDLDDLRGEVLNLLLGLDKPPLALEDVDAACKGTGEPIHAGPRLNAAEQLAALERVVGTIRERLFLRTLQEVK